MDRSNLRRILCERLTPSVLEFIQVSKHSVTIWDDLSTATKTSITVSYDELDLLTALWVNEDCPCNGGGQLHIHFCPTELWSYWRIKTQAGESIRLPYRITFSPAPARPYDCPHLNELRLRREGSLRGVLRQRLCLLPGPEGPRLICPPGRLRRRFPNLVVLPEAQLNLPRPTDLAFGE